MKCAWLRRFGQSEDALQARRSQKNRAVLNTRKRRRNSREGFFGPLGCGGRLRRGRRLGDIQARRKEERGRQFEGAPLTSMRTGSPALHAFRHSISEERRPIRPASRHSAPRRRRLQNVQRKFAREVPFLRTALRSSHPCASGRVTEKPFDDEDCVSVVEPRFRLNPRRVTV